MTKREFFNIFRDLFRETKNSFRDRHFFDNFSNLSDFLNNHAKDAGLTNHQIERLKNLKIKLKDEWESSF